MPEITCALTLMRPGDRKDCLKGTCSLWDSDKEQCVLTSFLMSYVKNQAMGVQILEAVDRFEAAIAKMEKEEDEDDIE